MHANVPSVAAACGLVNVSSVGMFGAIFTPEGVSSWPPSQRVPGGEAQAQVGSGAVQLERGELEPRQLRGAPRERAHVLQPAARAVPVRVGQAAEREEVLGEPPLALERRQLRVDLSGPVVGRPRGAGPARPHVGVRAPEGRDLLRDAAELGRDPFGTGSRRDSRARSRR